MPWRISAIGCPIRRWATSSVAMAFLRLPSADKPFHGKTLSVHTGTFWSGWTSSRAEVLTLKGLLTYYVLFFIHLETRRVSLAGFTPYPDQEWMEQQARNMT
ncbi:MAG TPA: hypothetical protein VJN92_12875, partial [Candidatus Acidoferrum sp.]|nr:hypothetical protein [Candidatus Acidoferrum sp.]